MAAYDDEKDIDMVQQGLEWHPKMLFRTEVSGLVINPYHTPIGWIHNRTEIEYWLGGLITGGVAPQLSDNIRIPFSHGTTKWDSAIRPWMEYYKQFGHLVEGGIRTLRYDAGCCHVQGL